MSRRALRLLNGIYAWVVGLSIAVASVFAAYSIWDNAQIYQAAQDVQTQVRQLKPLEAPAGGPSFQELMNLNSDVIGWITVDGTNIDYPVLQGQDNLEYMNKDVYGNFSLAGSIFLDVRNHGNFSDRYNLIYGHNMDAHLMFGDLALFKDQAFFTANRTATLLVPGETRNMAVAAILQLPAGTPQIFDPSMWANSLSGLGAFLAANSIWYDSYWINLLTNDPNSVEVDALVTCSSGSTNDRTVLILIRKRPQSDPHGGPDPGGNPVTDDPEPVIEGGGTPGGNPGGRNPGGPKKTGDRSDPGFWKAMIVLSIGFIAAFETVERIVMKRREE